jgi:hypothetical protein
VCASLCASQWTPDVPSRQAHKVVLGDEPVAAVLDGGEAARLDESPDPLPLHAEAACCFARRHHG